MTTGSVMLTAALHRQPYTQGHSSSLCGLYAILNGIQLALWPTHKLADANVKRLFNRGIEHLDSAGLLMSTLHVGIDDDPWLEMSRAIVQRSNELTGIELRRHFPLTAHKHPNRRLAIAAMKLQLRRERPIVTLLQGALDHATVIVGHSQSRMVLFDSIGLRWVATEGLGLQHQVSTKRHQLTRQTVMTLSIRGGKAAKTANTRKWTS